MYAFQASLPASRPPPVSFSPPNAPPISAPLVPILILAIPQSLPRALRNVSAEIRFDVTATQVFAAVENFAALLLDDFEAMQHVGDGVARNQRAHERGFVERATDLHLLISRDEGAGHALRDAALQKQT